MTSSNDLEDRLDQLGRDLGEQPSVVESVMSQLEPHKVRPKKESWSVSGVRAATIVAAACALLAASVFWLQPRSAYAKAMDALRRAQTIHVTGWSTHVKRSWRLETPKEETSDRHDIEMWFWSSVDGTSRAYEKCGPVVKIQTADSVTEYQEDVDLLYLAEGRDSKTAKHFATLAGYLRELDSDAQEDLGTRKTDGQTQRGVRVSRPGRVDEYWFDLRTDLPVTYTGKLQDDGKEVQYELRFSYDEQIPGAVADYSPPKAKTVRYGGQHENVNLAWKQHVQDLWLQEPSVDGNVRIVERDGGRSFENQWPMATPDGKCQVVPIDRDQYEGMNIDHFLRLRVAARHSDHDTHTWRVEGEGLLDMEFPRCDLVYVEGTPWQEWVQFFLNEQGLEYTDVVEQRTFWVAKHDGRELRSWRKVNPPVPYLMRNGSPQIGVIRTGIGKTGSPVTLPRLFDDFNTTQNSDYKGKHPVIVDETGLPKPPAWDKAKYPQYRQFREKVVGNFFVASDMPFFNGEEGQTMARDWYAKEFGITFKEEQRPMTIHVIRKQQ